MNLLDKKPHTRVGKGGQGATVLAQRLSAFAHAVRRCDQARPDSVGKGGARTEHLS
jgi:hypothetical protein